MTGRKDRSGNFGGRIDELVKHFPNGRTASPRKQEKMPPARDERHINDRLFERAWRAQRSPKQP